MGVSTDGIICYGLKLEAETEFPWDTLDEEEERVYEDFEEWWMSTRGYVDPLEGEAWDNATEEQKVAWLEGRKVWREANPMPIELVNYCSDTYEAYILAVPASVLTANRGYPKEITPKNTQFTSVADHSLWEEQILNFCREFGIEVPEDESPKWYLCSYWGQ